LHWLFGRRWRWLERRGHGFGFERRHERGRFRRSRCEVVDEIVRAGIFVAEVVSFRALI
jgi:hypothetical protein